MSLYNLTNATTPDGILIGVSETIPALPVMLLVFTWFFIFLGGSQKQSARYGYADIPQWSVLASLSVLLLGLIMTTTIGILTLPYLVIILALTILTAVWFFMSRGRVE
jgi:hypothetical protein